MSEKVSYNYLEWVEFNAIKTSRESEKKIKNLAKLTDEDLSSIISRHSRRWDKLYTEGEHLTHMIIPSVKEFVKYSDGKKMSISSFLRESPKHRLHRSIILGSNRIEILESAGFETLEQLDDLMMNHELSDTDLKDIDFVALGISNTIFTEIYLLPVLEFDEDQYQSLNDIAEIICDREMTKNPKAKKGLLFKLKCLVDKKYPFKVNEEFIQKVQRMATDFNMFYASYCIGVV